MQQNILAQGIRRLKWSDGSDGSLGEFADLFAGEGGVARAVKARGRAASAWEAYPDCLNDSGPKAPAYRREFDLWNYPRYGGVG